MIRGGLRSRLLVDSARVTIIAGLEQLGWFDATVHDTPPGLRRHRPLRYFTRPVEWSVPVQPNAIAITPEDVWDDPYGLGGEVADTLRVYVDIFAESDPLGWHLAKDIQGILSGQFGSLGRTAPVLDVYDLRQATPSIFTQVDIDDVVIDRAGSESRLFLNSWFMVRFDLLDEYADEFADIDGSTTWNPDLYSTWERIQAIEMSG